MFELPSIWNMVISTIVFIIAAWYFHRYLDGHGIPKGMTRGISVFVLAYFVSWAAGVAVDWAQEKIEGPRPVVQSSGDLQQLMKAVQQTQQ